MPNIHPTAVVHSSAKIDPAAEIGPYAVIGEDAVIGAGTKIGPHAVVEFATLGRNNILFPGCFVGTAPQDLKYAGERTRLVMGDGNRVRECVTLNRGTGTDETRIGSDCLFMAYSHVAHDCHLGSHVILANSAALAGHVEIGDHVVMGGMSGVHQFARIGRHAMLGGGSMNGKDVPPFCTSQGDRATLRGLNLLGMRRAGFSRDAVSAVKDAYKTLFMSGLPVEEALAQAKAAAAGPEVLELLRFVEEALKSKRGLMRPATGELGDEEGAV